MSERLLEAFREEAEALTVVPAFELIERQGRTLRRRRHAIVGAVAASILAVTGIVATVGGEPRTQQPTTPTAPSVTPYPGPDMTTLEKGTYELATPPVRFTVPTGWNAGGIGPDKFEGMGPQITDNEEVIDQGGVDWYVGLFVTETDALMQSDCASADASADVSGLSTPAVARVLTRIPSLDVISGPESTVRFGQNAVHVRLRTNTEPGCPWSFWIYTGGSEYDELRLTYDAWVVDVDGRPLLVWAVWTRKAPSADVRDLLGIVDSIEFIPPAD